MAYDDYDGIFDCEYAYKAWRDDAFRTADRGRGPVLHEGNVIASIGKDGKPLYTKEQYSVGSRTSRVYWRRSKSKMLSAGFHRRCNWTINEPAV
ncbi:hypothetical protein [Vibrio cidicii]|uniref:hypothetical protein n=1 Tax=Vibrio cidicii TaxID=1763883 RepID=UPI0037049831